MEVFLWKRGGGAQLHITIIITAFSDLPFLRDTFATTKLFKWIRVWSKWIFPLKFWESTVFREYSTSFTMHKEVKVTLFQLLGYNYTNKRLSMFTVSWRHNAMQLKVLWKKWNINTTNALNISRKIQWY